jgi:hypothetical protein
MRKWELCAVAVLGSVLTACAGEEPSGGGQTVETYMVEDIEVRTDGNVEASGPFRVDSVTIELGPAEGKEYKYRLEEGDTMLYSWVASGPVRTEMHSEVDGGPEGTAEFFDVDLSGEASHGAFTAPLPGIHGWYWLNLSEAEPVTVTVRSSGFYSYAVEFPGGQTHQVDDVTEVAYPD